MRSGVEAAWAVLEELTDPEIPVISLRELGILRDVR
ncbi:MAG: phenylacetate-CoA oxygenase subunit PaaJ, partial [Dechloromonas agitata]|nr:phenylacetate-CoA oxygenase subunit PaaJ [Dechloromonas agitata]